MNQKYNEFLLSLGFTQDSIDDGDLWELKITEEIEIVVCIFCEEEKGDEITISLVNERDEWFDLLTEKELDKAWLTKLILLFKNKLK